MRISLLAALAAAVIAVFGAPLAFASDALATAEVAKVDLPRVYRLDGVAEAVNRGTLSAQTSGRVVEINVDVRDVVDAGAVIVRLDDTQQRAAVARAEANLKSAEAGRQDADKAFQRAKAALAKGAVPQADFDSAGAARKAARAGEEAASAALAQAQQELAYTQIEAPYNGIVTERLIEVGETAAPGTPLISGLSLDTMRVSVDVPQNLVAAIRREGKAQVEIDGRWVPVESVTVFPVADPRSDTFEVRLTLPEGTKGVFPGMYVKVGFVAGVDEGLVIPLSAVVTRSEVVGVYVVDADGTVRFRHVRLGSPAGPDHVSLLAGLHAGERVATNPVDATIRLKSQRNARVSDE